MTKVRSSYCRDDGCVEVEFRTSSYSNGQGDCVAVAKDGETVLVRDTKDPNGAALTFTTNEWDAFIKGVKDGEFDL
jgi:predicted secreted Zn-dependent protease